MFPSSDGPRYVPGGIALAIFCLLVCMSASSHSFFCLSFWKVIQLRVKSVIFFSVHAPTAATTIKFTLRWQNKKMDQLDAQGKPYTGAIEGVPKGYRFTS